MDAIKNPFCPGAGSPPPELVGREGILEQARVLLGRIKEKPVVVDGEICIRKMMWLSLTFDHRLVDGGPAARFLQYIKQLVEEPFLMLV